MDAGNKEIIDRFLEYKVGESFASADTFRHYGDWLRLFANFIEDRNYSFLTVKPEVFIEYRKSLVITGKRPDSIRSYLAPVKGIYQWMSSPIVNLIPINPFPQMRLEASIKHPDYIPDAKMIFQIRNRGKFNKLLSAVAFEMYLSSGMRCTEMLQLRCCDIIWGCKVKDNELGKISPYIGAHAYISPTMGIKVKRNARRTVYFSKLATKLLKKYIEQLGVNEKSNLPLFPMNRRDMLNVIHKIAKRMIGTSNIFAEEKKAKREQSFLDIDVSKITAPIAYKNKIIKIQEQELKARREGAFRVQTTSTMNVRKPSLYIHALRHCFALFMYYRNWIGSRRDIIILRDLLGHASTRTTDVYVTQRLACDNDAEWRRLWLGNGFEYMKFLRKE